MSTSLRALSGAIKTALDAAARALGYANVADVAAKAATKAVTDIGTSTDTVRVIVANVSDVQADVTAKAASATTQAGIATTKASEAATSATASATSATASATAQALAEAARDAANTSARSYTAAQGTAAALADAAVTTGQSFSVLAADLKTFTVYRKDAGPVATLLYVQATKAYIDGVVPRSFYRSWVLAFTDAAGKLAGGFNNAGRLILSVGGDIVARITANETNIAAQTGAFVRTTARGTYAFVILDAAKTKIAFAIDKAGTLITKGRDILAELDALKSYVTSAVSTVTNALKTDGLGRGGASIALSDATGRAPLKVNRKGRVLLWDRDVLTELDAVTASAALGVAQPTVRESTNYLVLPFTDGAGKRQLKSLRKSDGKVTTLTTTGNNIGASVTTDGAVLFVTDAGGAYVQKWIPADGGAIADTLALPSLACWGDSLTAGAGSTGGQTYPVQLVALLGDARSAYNGGIGGQTAAQIVARQGGALSLLTVTGNQIPASGAVAVTARTVSLITSQGQQSFTGTLAGVPGTLARAGDDSYSFTRSTAGGVVACPAGTPFVPDVAVQHRGEIALLILGRNSFTADPTPLLASIAACIAYLTPYYKQFLVGLVLNSTTEVIGSGTYNNIKANNDAIKAAWPGNYVDTQSPPTVDEMAALTFVPDATDNTDIANGCIPTHMRNFGASDTLHLNNYGYGLWALRFKNAIQSKGW